MGNVSDKYPTEPLSEKYDATILINYNLYSIKSIADSLGIQIDISFKPDGLRLDFIRKVKGSRSVKKQTEYINNADLLSLPAVVSRCSQMLML